MSKSRVFGIFGRLRLAALALTFAVLGTTQAQPIKVLFWGGQDNAAPPHLPRNLRDTLAPWAATNNLEMNFRESATHSWLNPDSLNQFDVILVYAANRGSGFAGGSDITTAQMNALTAWIASGRVMVVLHGSSNAYQHTSNAAWRALLGASFLDHGPLSGTGNAGTITFTQPGHPTLAGALSLPTSAANAGGTPYWDEGRRHQNFSPDTVVLARSQLSTTVNVPWIWVRPQGLGWVYFNSSGHDGETWRRIEWKSQVLRALNWGYQIKTTGIRGKAALEQLTRGPNGILRVPFATKHSVEILDMQGRTKFFRGNSYAPTYDLGFLPAGTYGVRILSEGQEAYKGLYLKPR